MSKKPALNVVCLIADDTDPDNLGCYGGDVFLTPHLDALAASGVRFTRAHAVAPVCTPSRYAYLTGQYPSRCPNHFRESNPLDDVPTITWNTDLVEGQMNLATVFRDRGYATGYVGKFHCGRSPADIGMKKVNELSHFDPELRHDPYDPAKDAIHRHNQECIQRELNTLGWQDVRNATWGNLDGNPWHDLPHNLEWTTRGAVDFLDARAESENPFLLCVGYHTIHGPKHGEDLDTLDSRVTAGGLLPGEDLAGHPPRASVPQRLRDQGLDPFHRNVGALWMDDSVGVILDRLETLGLAENTLVIFKADHGKFGKATVYNNGSHVPMIWRWPEQAAPGGVCRAFVQNIDFLPTLCDACGIRLPDDSPVDGLSYLSRLQGDPAPLREYFYNEMGSARSVQTERWKYVALRYPRKVLNRLREGSVSGPPDFFGNFSPPDNYMKYHSAYYDAEQLYEIQQDRAEHFNLAANPDYAEILAELRSKLWEFSDQLPHDYPREPDPVQLRPEFRELTLPSPDRAAKVHGKKSVFGMRFW